MKRLKILLILFLIVITSSILTAREAVVKKAALPNTISGNLLIHNNGEVMPFVIIAPISLIFTKIDNAKINIVNNIQRKFKKAAINVKTFAKHIASQRHKGLLQNRFRFYLKRPKRLQI